MIGDGGGDNCGELPASLMSISSPILSAVSATIAVSSASSSSSSDDDDEEDDEADEEEEEDDDDTDEEDELDEERGGGTSSLCISNSLIDILRVFFFLSGFLAAVITLVVVVDFGGDFGGDFLPMLSVALLSLSRALWMVGDSSSLSEVELDSELDDEPERSLRRLDADGLA